MHVISTFKQSNFLELSIKELEKKGIPKNNIFAVPMDKRASQRKIFDSIYHADGISLFDGAAAMSTVFMTLGTIYGYIWKGGPILWGLVGCFFGAILGFIFDFFIGRKRRNRVNNVDEGTEVVLLIQCDESQGQMVEQILWDNFALGVAKVTRNKSYSSH